jgi:hypothetical protein
MQTYLVHMRSPSQLWRQLGPRGFVDFQMLVGASALILLLNPLMWLLTAAYGITKGTVAGGFIESLFPAGSYYPALISLLVGNFVLFYCNAYVSVRRNHLDLARFAVFTPAYWLLMSAGAWVGLVSLIRSPSYWAKTEHGLSMPVRVAQPAFVFRRRQALAGAVGVFSLMLIAIAVFPFFVAHPGRVVHVAAAGPSAAQPHTPGTLPGGPGALPPSRWRALIHASPLAHGLLTPGPTPAGGSGVGPTLGPDGTPTESPTPGLPSPSPSLPLPSPTLSPTPTPILPSPTPTILPSLTPTPSLPSLPPLPSPSLSP